MWPTKKTREPNTNETPTMSNANVCVFLKRQVANTKSKDGVLSPRVHACVSVWLTPTGSQWQKVELDKKYIVPTKCRRLASQVHMTPSSPLHSHLHGRCTLWWLSIFPNFDDKIQGTAVHDFPAPVWDTARQESKFGLRGVQATKWPRSKTTPKSLCFASRGRNRQSSAETQNHGILFVCFRGCPNLLSTKCILSRRQQEIDDANRNI